MRQPIRRHAAGLMTALLLAVPLHAAGQTPAAPARTGRQVYESTCTTCHGPDGKGGVNAALEQLIALPDFSDCSFANREPDSDWLAVAHNGGPARGFSPLMAPWGGAFTEAELVRAIGHVRTFCTDERWPRGELNLPLALVTGKAFPEDEALMRVTSRSGSVVTQLVYERRFGPLNQWEVIVPIASAESASGRSTGVGDIALEYKRVLTHSLARGHILSATAEVILPTGSERKGLGNGFAIVEPFVTFGQILPRDSFIQAQAGVEVPLEDGRHREAFWRVAAGRSLEQGRFGRTWSPMFELLAARPLASGARIEWDVVPQVQVTLNRRQHVRVNAGVRVPVNERGHRRWSTMVYLLWDWFDGGFLDGW